MGRLACVLWVLVVIVVAFVFYPRVIGIFGTGALVVGMLPVFAVLVAMERSTKCPRCKGRLAMGNKLGTCPHCGVSMDVPMYGPVTQK
jgi:ribosomal protein L37AE/L43A